MTTPPADVRSPSPEETTRFTDYAGEATGFGEIEFRTARDLLIRPRTVLDAYLSRGPTGGGRYARPWGFYIALCGILMFYMFLMGGMKGIIAQQPAETIAAWAAAAGKTREVFIADTDSWMSFVAVPILSVFYALGAVPLLKWWSGLDWRRTFRSTFALLCAWTVPMLPLGPLPMMKGFELIGTVFMWGLLVVTFLRMGKGLWFTTWPGGVGKALALGLAMMIGVYVGMIPVFNIGLLGGLYGG